ncbi:MAG: hypothetical protein OIF50_09680 [Flavobacteriaceae bacterium]|nr:hypothetical protein [Flavobacteriaceae bacterium]
MKSRLKQYSRIFLGVFMVFAGFSRFGARSIEFRAVVPRWLTNDVYWMDILISMSAYIEIALGLATIFLVKHQKKIGYIYAVFLVIVFTGNLSQYTNQIDAFGLNTDQKRMIRLFFQPVLIIWILWATNVKKQTDSN